jgi:type IV pilus assembly protein PilQ
MKKRFLFIACCWLVVCLGFVAAGCDKKPQDKDGFVEKWRVAAEQSQGRSVITPPSPDTDEKNLQDQEGYDDIRSLLEKEDVNKPLPKTSISLEMRKANLVAVLAALSKAASISIIVSPGIEGIVTVNVEKKAWDEVFEGLLKTHGLSYSWEGDIIRVKTLDDMRKEVELTAVKAQGMIQKTLLQRAEPRVTRVIKIHYMTAKNMAMIVGNIVFHKEGKYKRTEKTKDDSKALKDTSEEGEIKQKAEGEAYGEKAGETKALINVDGYVSDDSDSNSIVVHCSRPLMKIVYYLVKKLDKPRSQIKLKAYIIETDSSTARELGIRWGGIMQTAGSPDKAYFTSSQSNTAKTSAQKSLTTSYNYGAGASGSGFTSAFPSTWASSTMGYGLEFMYGLIGENILDVQLQALQQDSKVKILSNPSLTTLDNKEAYMEDGVQVPYSIWNANEGTYTTIWKDAVLKLKMTPRVVNTDVLRLEVQIKKDEVDTTQTDNAGNPYIKKKTTETNFVVRTGETIVISGLTKKTIKKGDYGIPYLKDVPILGWVFKGDTKGEELNEVLIFITPTILPGGQPGDMQKSLQQIEKELQEEGVNTNEMYDSMQR